MQLIGKKIRQLRLSLKISADEVAEKIGRKGANKKQYVYDLENGRIKRIDLITLNKIAGIFNVPISYFLDTNPGAVVHAGKKISIDDNQIESVWKEKYYESLQTISELKSQIIELMKQLKA